MPGPFFLQPAINDGAGHHLRVHRGGRQDGLGALPGDRGAQYEDVPPCDSSHAIRLRHPNLSRAAWHSRTSRSPDHASHCYTSSSFGHRR